MKVPRKIIVMAYSNKGTRIKLEVVDNTDDLTEIIKKAIERIEKYKNDEETFKIEHIESKANLIKSKEDVYK